MCMIIKLTKASSYEGAHVCRVRGESARLLHTPAAAVVVAPGTQLFNSSAMFISEGESGAHLLRARALRPHTDSYVAPHAQQYHQKAMTAACRLCASASSQTCINT